MGGYGGVKMEGMLKGEGPGPLPPLLQQYVELRDRYPDYRSEEHTSELQSH